jgi:type II secretory pathway pseudopilin PulG
MIAITIALPKLSRSRMYSQETAAISAIRTLHTAEVQYFASYGRYATSLAELGPPASGSPDASATDMIKNDLANGAKQGYQFAVTGTPGGYAIVAAPQIFGTTGSRTFYSDQTMIIRQNYGPEPATASSEELR